MKISIGASRTAKKWKTDDIGFEELARRVSQPVVTGETLQTFLGMGRDSQTEIKDVGGFVLGALRGGIRSNKTVGTRSGIALDLDNFECAEELSAVRDKLNGFGHVYCLHSTHKSTREKPRVRILFPLSRDVDAEEYEFIARVLCGEIGMAHCDKTTAQPARLMFWPSVPRDTVGEFIYAARLESDGFKPLDPDSLLNKYPNWRDRTTWPVFPNEIPKIGTGGGQLDDPRGKDGVVGLFCRAYTIPEAIAAYLGDVYEETDDPRRYTYIPGTSSKGAVVYGAAEYGADVFLYSFHGTDPAGGRTCNAFDLVRIHKFSDTKISQKKMESLAWDDARVKKLKAEEDARAKEDFVNSVKGDAGFKQDEWREAYESLQADLEKDGRNKNRNASTIDNALQIMRRDPFLMDSYYYDSFADKVVIWKDAMPWPGQEGERAWKDSDDAGIQWYLEKVYQIKGEQTIMKALTMTCEERAIHPIKNYLESLTWDGIPRLDTLLIDYFGAEDNPYTRDIMRKSLVAAVTRIYEPGAKFDTMPILVGNQGIGKSTFIDKLARDWYSDSVTDFVGKDSYELLQNNWLIEIPELNGFSRYEMNQIKHFLSKRIDEYRAPYKRRKESHPRQCVFFGTTNDKEFLRDKTGNRRFWPVQLGVTENTKSVFKDLDAEVDQIWAEAYAAYRMGETLYLEDESKKISEIEQKNRLEEDPREGLIVEFLKREIPEDWDTWNLTQRMAYWSNPEDFTVETKKRDRVCVAEILCELFDEHASRIDKRRSREVNDIIQGLPGTERMKKTARFGEIYGVQRGFLIDPDLL